METIKQLQAELSEKELQLESSKNSSNFKIKGLEEELRSIREELTLCRLKAEQNEQNAWQEELRNAALQERLASTSLAADDLKVNILSAEEQVEIMRDRVSDLEAKNGELVSTLERKEASIKKLRSKINETKLSDGVGFGRKEQRTVDRTGDNQALNEQAQDLEARLAKVLSNFTKAQAVIKKQKEKYAESEKARKRLESDLTKSLELCRKTEDELQKKNRRLQTSAMTRDEATVREPQKLEKKESKLSKQHGSKGITCMFLLLYLFVIWQRIRIK